jgi:hypothetical protein
MHFVPIDAPQQSLVVVHFSEFSEQPPLGGLQTFGELGSFGSLGRQKPSQHSSPVSQLLPFALQGSRAQ